MVLLLLLKRTADYIEPQHADSLQADLLIDVWSVLMQSAPGRFFRFQIGGLTEDKFDQLIDKSDLEVPLNKYINTHAHTLLYTNTLHA